MRNRARHQETALLPQAPQDDNTECTWPSPSDGTPGCFVVQRRIAPEVTFLNAVRERNRIIRINAEERLSFESLHWSINQAVAQDDCWRQICRFAVRPIHIDVLLWHPL